MPGLAERAAGVPAFAGRCRNEQARLGGAEGARPSQEPTRRVAPGNAKRERNCNTMALYLGDDWSKTTTTSIS